MGFDKNSDCQRTLQTFQPNSINRVNEPDRCFQETHSVLWSSDGGTETEAETELEQASSAKRPFLSMEFFIPGTEHWRSLPDVGLCFLQLYSYEHAQYAREQNTLEPSSGASLQERQKVSPHLAKIRMSHVGRPPSSVCTWLFTRCPSILLMKTGHCHSNAMTEDVWLSCILSCPSPTQWAIAGFLEELVAIKLFSVGRCSFLLVDLNMFLLFSSHLSYSYVDGKQMVTFTLWYGENFSAGIK